MLRAWAHRALQLGIGTRPGNWLSPKLRRAPVRGHLSIAFAYSL